MENIQPMLMMYLTSNIHTMNIHNMSTTSKIVSVLTIIFSFILIAFFNKISFIDIVADYINDILINFNKKNQVIIYLDSHIINIRASSQSTMQKIKYSDDYLSVLNYIETNHMNIKNLKILREIMTNYMEKYWDEKDSSEFMKIPVQHEHILIENDKKIYCQILTKLKNDDDDKKNNYSKYYDIRLYKWIEDDAISTRKVLINFLADCKKMYFEKINPKTKDNKLIYEYKKMETNDECCKEDLIYNEYTFKSNKTFDNLFFDNKNEMINYVKKFIYEEDKVNEYENICAKSGITYKAGMLFYGEPGCGKTSAIKAILNYTNRVGVIVNLGKLKSNQELQAVFRNYYINKKKYKSKEICFILEDCDAIDNDVLLDRNEKNIKNTIEQKTVSTINNDKSIDSSVKLIDLMKQESTFDFSCLLNVFDGMIELDGVMIIMTTNYPDKLDKALIREGRIDFKHEFKLSSTSVIKDIIQRRYDISDDEYNKLNHINDLKSETLSPAKIQTICGKEDEAQKAINIIYEKSLFNTTFP